MWLDVSILVGLAVLTVLAGLVIRWRVLKRTGRTGPGLQDQDIDRIIETGCYAVEDDPLDMDEVREAEERFWSENWDEAEEV